jgi:hypothetical protein
MKKRLFLGTALLLCCGCSSMNNTEAGALGGGAIGGLLGAGLGAVAHAPIAGAAIGAATGALIGGAAGASEDRQEHREQVQLAAASAAAQQAAARAPRYEEIVAMTKNGVRDEVIITQIRTSGAGYAPTADDINYLTQNGVSSAVIMAVQSQRPGAVYPPLYYGRPYYYDPPPVTVGVGYVGGWRRW